MLSASSSAPRAPAWIPLAIGLAFAAQVVAGLAVHSGTCDELGAHLPAGILFWKTGHPTSGLANPPLGQLLLAAGPVLTGGADHPLRERPQDLLPARLPVAALGLLLVFAVGRLGSRAGGPTVGLAAAGAAALSPDLVAHAGFATLDLPVAAFTTVACGLAWRWTRAGGAGTLVAWAFAIATACMIKSTALLVLFLVPLGAAVLPGSPLIRLRRGLLLLLTGGAMAAAAAWLLYGPGPPRLLLPAAYVDSVLGKFGQASRGQFAYLMGRRSAHGFAWYFAVALAVKTPLPLQLCGLVGAGALVRRKLTGDVSGFAALVLLPALGLLAWMSWVHRVHIGVRHVLPALPALLVLAGAGWATLFRWGTPGRLAAGAVAVWAIVTAARITPDQPAYFNELAGGPAVGDRWLIDSNLDWGQDEGRFRAWARGHAVTVNPDRPTDGLVAANVNALHGILTLDDLRLRWLTRFTPVRTFGYSFRVYDVTEDPLREAAERDPLAALDYAWWLVGMGRPDEARRELDGVAKTDVVRSAHAREYWRVRGEVELAAGDLPAAHDAAERVPDPDLAAEVEYRERERTGKAAGVAETARAIRALARRGHPEEASALGVSVFGRDPLALPPAAAAIRWTEAGRLRALGRERDALALVGRALAADPRNDDALWLYGELVVRRKLGLAEYPWPEVDWSSIRRPERGR